MPGPHLLPVRSQLSGRPPHSTIGSRYHAESKPRLVSPAICPPTTGPVHWWRYCWSGHWLKIIWQRIPNFKNCIFRTSFLLFVATSPSATWRESRTYDPQHNIRAIEIPYSTMFALVLPLQNQSYMWQRYINTTHSFNLWKCSTQVVEFVIQTHFS